MWKMLILANGGQLNGTAVILLFGALAVIAFVLLRTSRQLGRQMNEPGFSRPKPSEPAATPHHLHAPAQVQHFEVELHDMVREASARLDTKMRALEALILEADKRIARLESASLEFAVRNSEVGGEESGARSREGGIPRSKVQGPTMEVGGPVSPDARGPKPVARSLTPATQADALAALAQSQTAVLPRLETASQPAAAAGRHDEIYILADRGLSAAAIAQRLGAPQGEVELILNLRTGR